MYSELRLVRMVVKNTLRELRSYRSPQVAIAGIVRATHRDISTGIVSSLRDAWFLLSARRRIVLNASSVVLAPPSPSEVTRSCPSSCQNWRGAPRYGAQDTQNLSETLGWGNSR